MDLQVFVDRVIVEAFAMKGRGAVIAMEYRPDAPSASSIHLLGTDIMDRDMGGDGDGGGGVQLENLTVWEMGCGYTSTVV